MANSDTGRSRRPWRRLVVVGVILLVGACSSDEPRRRRSSGPGTQLPQAALHPDVTVPHGDHTPHKGGTVMMYGDLHYEVILERDGRYELWLSDDLRNELPASDVEGVTFTVRPPEGEGEMEVIALEPDAENTRWFGTGLPIDNPKTIARIGFEYQEERYWIDLMFPQAQFGVTEETETSEETSTDEISEDATDETDDAEEQAAGAPEQTSTP